jgi:hypothetical protein
MNKIVELKLEETKAVTGGNRYDVGVIARPPLAASHAPLTASPYASLVA